MHRALIWFLAVSFGFSWTVAEVYYRLLPASPTGNMLTAMLFMYGPALGALAATRVGWRRPLSSLGPLWRWSPALMLVLLLPLGFAMAHVGVAAVVPGLSLNLDAASLASQILQNVPAEHQALANEQLAKLGQWLPLVLLAQILVGGLIAGLTINALVAFGEELGWRGFLHQYFAGHSFWQRSMLIGVFWGIWHAPLILRGHNYPDHPVVGVAMMIVFCLLWSPLYELVRERTGSVIYPAIMHGTMNATAGTMVFVTGSDLLRGPTGVAGMLVLLLINVLLYWQRGNAVASRVVVTA